MEWETAISRICETPSEADWVPREAAGYHIATSWYILAEALSRIAETPFPKMVQTQIFNPLSMGDSWVGMPETSYFSYDDRMAWMYRTHGENEPDESLNSVEGAARVRPGGNGRGPIRELGRFFEMLLAGGAEVLRCRGAEVQRC